jgi:glycosyltransferase involved in cell wall biosynthesis
VKFYIYGDGAKEPLLNVLINEYKMTDRVHLKKGFIKWENVPSIIAEHDIILSTSLTESFCLLILEAIASGLYVISTGNPYY